MIELIEVEKSYLKPTGDPLLAIAKSSLSIQDGEIFGIIGRSGAGKSTLLRLINGLERPSHGRVLIDGTDIARLDAKQLNILRQHIGMIFQHFNLLTSKTVAENIALPLQISGQYDSVEVKKRVNALLLQVGLSHKSQNYPSQLSGGEKQRVGIARAIALQPKILLCDEATSALDPETTKSILKLLGEINRSLGLTIVLITHEMDVIRTLCDKVVVLDSGHIVETGNTANVFLHPKHPTTRSLVQESEHVDEKDQLLDFANVPGRIVRFTYQGHRSFEPFISQIARSTKVDFNILSGRIDRIKDTPYGQLILSLVGNNQEEALEALKKQGVIIEELRP